MRPNDQEYQEAKAVIASYGDKLSADLLNTDPVLNKAFLTVQEWVYGYRELSDQYRSTLTREQRRVGVRFPYRGQDGKRHVAGANRSSWLCWLRKRSQNHALPKAIAARISAEYHEMTLKEYLKAAA